MEQAPSGTAIRLARIDFLRGLAVALVLGRHMPLHGLDPTSPWLFPLCLWERIGWTGVDLFFVLSGFLVSGLLFREYRECGNVDMGRFFLRRALRIYIPFYAFLFPSLLFRMAELTPARLAIEVFFLQSYFPGGAAWNHTWTLAVEEHFYLLVGLIAFVLLRQKNNKDPFRMVVPIGFLLGVGCLFLRLGTPYDHPSVLVNSHMRFDSLFCGVALSYLYHFRRDGFERFVRRFRLWIALLSAVLFLPAVFFEPGTEPFMTRFGLSFLYLSFGGVLALALADGDRAGAKTPGTAFRLLAKLGVISYSVYLWHMPARELVVFFRQPISSIWQVWAVALVYLAAAVAAGEMFYRFVEKPSLAWRDRRFPKNGLRGRGF